MILHGQNILAVASDFDGTIIKEGMSAPPSVFFEVVEKLLAQNIPFIAASGRQYANLRRMLHPVADRIQYNAENGCLVIYGGKVIHKSVIPADTAMELASDMQLYPDARILVSGENTSYIVTDDTAYVDLLRNFYHNNVMILKNYQEIPEDIIKMSIYWEKGIPERPERIFHDKYDRRLQVTDGGNGWLDFNGPGTGKGEALEILCRHMGIPVSQVAAFGDNENDLTMLKKAGVSYAVASARPHVQKEAGYVCDSVEQVLMDALSRP